MFIKFNTSDFFNTGPVKKTHTIRKINLSICLCILGIITAVAQSKEGVISGNVYTDNQKPLVNANILIEELQKGAISDSNGNFEITNIPFGDYTVTASMIGYNTISKKITINKSKVKKINFICSDSSTELQEVVITAEKKESSLQKVAIAVSAISSKDIEARKIVQYSDLLGTIPNFITSNAGSPTLNMMSTRGILTFSTDPALGVYIDGVPMFSGYGSSIQLLDIERIEILRGPQSTLYGRNALGGIIQIITKKPTNQTQSFAEIGLGNYNTQRYGIGVSGPLVKDKLFAGFNFLYNTYKGYTTNQYTNNDFDQPKNYNGNLNLKYLANDRLKFTLNAKAEKNDITGTFPYAINYQEALENPRTVNLNGTNIETRKLLSTSLLTEYRGDSYALSSTTGYTLREGTYEDYDIDYTPYDVFTYESFQQQKSLSQEFKIVTNQDKKVQFTGGLFSYYDWFKSPNTYKYGLDSGDYAGYVYTSTNTIRLYGAAAYGNITYAIGSKWKLNAGLRFDYEERNLESYVGDVQIDSETTTLDSNDNALSSKFSASYQANKDMMFYASYASGFRQGGFNSYSVDPDHFTYKPEYTNNYEVGVKSEWWNHKLRANMSLYYIKWDDQQQTVNAQISGYTDNIGEMTSKGLEIELIALPVKNLELSYSLGLVDTEYQNLILPDENGLDYNYKENKQVFTPSYTSNLSLNYNTDIAKNLNLFVVPQWTALGKQYFNYYNDLVQDPYSLINLNLGVKYKNYEFSLWGKNLADTEYLSFAYATSTASAASVLYANPPLTFGFTFKVKFNGLHND